MGPNKLKTHQVRQTKRHNKKDGVGCDHKVKVRIFELGIDGHDDSNSRAFETSTIIFQYAYSK